MLIGISGSICSGKQEIVRYLTYQGFEYIALHETPAKSEPSQMVPEVTFQTFEDLFSYITKNWRKNMVILPLTSPKHVEALSVRPFFLHVMCDAPTKTRFLRHQQKHPQHDVTFEEFVELGEQSYSVFLHSSGHPTIRVYNNANTTKDLYVQLSQLDMLNPLRLRPNWDTYFMRLADLAALRLNCMKRRVGCVIVKESRVIATGYNGTPRHLPNCNEGGCERCNEGGNGGTGLSTCLCLHAEENALLESGRERVAHSRATLYCNTCPCLTCSIKIIQCGISEVVYSQSYSMDQQSRKILNDAGVVLRQFQWPRELIG